jgi:hypothetical protein
MSSDTSKNNSLKIEEYIQRAEKWISSKEGKETLETSSKRTAEILRQLEEQSRVDPKALYEPFTI